MGSHASPEAASVLDSLRRIVQFIRESSSHSQQRTGLSAAQLFVLQQLQAAGGTLTPGDLARRTLTHQSSVSVVARRLVDAGLVMREQTPRDRRRVALSLTSAGRAAARKAPAVLPDPLIGAVDRLTSFDRAALARRMGHLVPKLGMSAPPPPLPLHAWPGHADG